MSVQFSHDLRGKRKEDGPRVSIIVPVYNVENYVGKYIVDLGGITTCDYTCTDKIGRLEIVG